MAGSYHHVRHGWSLIENMRDAYECVEELFWLVEKLIGVEEAERQLEVFYSMKRGEHSKDDALLFVEAKMKDEMEDGE